MYLLSPRLESDHHERKIDQVVKMLGSGDTETIKEGLDALDTCLYVRKRLITTIAGIMYLSHNQLVTRSLPREFILISAFPIIIHM